MAYDDRVAGGDLRWSSDGGGRGGVAAYGRWRRHTPVEETGQEGTCAACCQIFGTVQIFGGEALIFRKAQISSEAPLLREAQIFGSNFTSLPEEPNYLEKPEYLEKLDSQEETGQARRWLLGQSHLICEECCSGKRTIM